MRRYKVTESKEATRIICNKCGKEIVIEQGIMKEDVLEVEKRWGYFSEKDNQVDRFDLCEKCYDEFVASFHIPIGE